MEMKLEPVPMPVPDIDRARAFYVDAPDFREDVDGNSWTLQEMSSRIGDRF
jgi:catechol 2,3-dioxygenase-like lactoylglutathione lyase family enzyme